VTRILFALAWALAVVLVSPFVALLASCVWHTALGA
jgi:hypothetical protein